MSIVILLVIAVTGGVWWFGTRHYDFLKPPSESRMQMIRAQAAISQPTADFPAEDAPIPAGTVQPVEPLNE